MAEKILLQPDNQRILDTLDALKVYFDPVRTRIMQLLVKPNTVHQIAQALNVPFTRLYYHMNLLEKHGLIRVVETRSMPGAIEEKYYQITAHEFVVARELLTVSQEKEDDGLRVLLSTVVDPMMGDIRNSARAGLIEMSQTPPDARALLMRRGFLRLSPEKASDFQRRLSELVSEFSRDQDEDGMWYGVIYGCYPSIFPEAMDEIEV